MATAKILYFNWYRVANTKDQDLLGKVTMGGELLGDRPDLYDYVGDFYIGSGTPPYMERCDEAYRAYNRVDEGDMKGKEIRSMSVGDIVLFPDARMFVCQMSGWKEVPRGIDKLAFWGRPLVKKQDWDDNPLMGGKSKEGAK